MSRVMLIVIVALLAVLGVGALVLGAFPPQPHTQTVQHALPNDRFAPKSP